MRELAEAMKRAKIVAIIRGIGTDRIVDTARALYGGGIRFMEITFDQGAEDGIGATCEAIRLVKEALPEAAVGAGTVMTVPQVEAAREAGAEFIISPDVNTDVIRRTAELRMVSMPGAMTPTEAARAYAAGADFVKLFPVTSLGPDYIKAIRGPLGHIPMMAVGGVDLGNMGEFYRAGACGFGIGGCLVNRGLIESGKYGELKELAAAYAEAAAKL